MKDTPVRLAKETHDNTTSFDVFLGVLIRYSPYIVLALIIILILLIIMLVFAVAQAGGANMTMVESGNWYNHMQDVI